MTTANPRRLSRREACRLLAVGSLGVSLPATAFPATAATDGPKPSFSLRYILASSMYGTTKIEDILPEVAKTGARHIDVWPRHHADQREQIEAMGHEAFAQLLHRHKVGLGMFTRYDLGPLGLADEMRVAEKFGASMIVTGSRGPKGLAGPQCKAAVRRFVEAMKPHIAVAEQRGVTIGIENHAGSLISSPESIRYLAEFSPSDRLGIALAPYHLPQEPGLLARLIEDLGEKLVHFYAWQHGQGCMTKLPKAEELEQMPGRGPLDFEPLLRALAKIDYRGWTEVFMHPVPRGIPILETTAAVTEEINRSRRHLNRLAPALVPGAS